jgi:hypothetical protein
MKTKKFSNPATQFAGTWRVDSYDFREFESAPEDMENQIKKSGEFSDFPVGQIVEFVPTGIQVMPGTIDPATMTSDGPTGHTLENGAHS